MYLAWINQVSEFYRPQYEKITELIDLALRDTLSSDRLLDALHSYSPPRDVLEAAAAYIFAMTITAPYADEDEAPEWVYEIEDIGIMDWLDTQSDESMILFGRLYRAGAKDHAHGAAATLLAGIFDPSKPREAVIARIIDEWVINYAQPRTVEQYTRGLWRLIGATYLDHLDMPEIEGGTNPEQVKIRSDAADLARILWRAGFEKKWIATRLDISRPTLDRWLKSS